MLVSGGSTDTGGQPFLQPNGPSIGLPLNLRLYLALDRSRIELRVPAVLDQDHMLYFPFRSSIMNTPENPLRFQDFNFLKKKLSTHSVRSHYFHGRSYFLKPNDELEGIYKKWKVTVKSYDAVMAMQLRIVKPAFDGFIA